MHEKRKTCITISKSTGTSNFTEYLNIPHRVDIIRVTAIGGFIFNATPELVDSIFYLKSDLISGNIHDNVLGTFGNLNYSTNSTKIKEFLCGSGSVNGSYNFQIFDLANQRLITYTEANAVFIDLEFIEYDKS